jgi:hypothetical protein
MKSAGSLHSRKAIMAAILCEQVGLGMQASERCVSVRVIHGHREWLLVEQNFLAVRQDKTYLPVGIIQVDREREVVLVEFPHEAATGGNRVWVRVDTPADDKPESYVYMSEEEFDWLGDALVMWAGYRDCR